MVADAEMYAENEIVSYANGLVQVMKQHGIILPEEEDDFKNYLAQ